MAQAGPSGNMRFALPLLAILALALAFPAASAQASSTITMSAPAQADVNVSIPVEISLTLTDFACAADTTFTATLTASTSGTAAPAPGATEAAFAVPAGSYLLTPWSGNTTANFTVQGDAATTNENVTIHATFAPASDGSCVTSGGSTFAPSETSVTIHVGTGRPISPTPAPAPTPTPVVNDTTPTPVTEPTPTSTTPPPTNSTPSNGTVDQLPPGGGYIGDYKPPAESTKSTPGVAVWGAVAAIGTAAVIVARRR